MSTVTILEAKERLADLVREAEAGETVILTRDGEPFAQIKPMSAQKAGSRLDEMLAGVDAYKKKHGIENIFPYIPDDFDEPLPRIFSFGPCRQIDEG